MEKPVLLSDIAREAGVTKMTVSLALRGNPRISSKTRLKIEKIAAELGYEPNPAARALSSKRHQQAPGGIFGTVAILFDAAHDEVVDPPPEESDWFSDLKTCCRKLGYGLDRFVVGPTEKEQRALSRILKARGIRGIIVIGDNAEIQSWKLDWKWFAAVTFSSSMHEHFALNIMSSSHQDVYDAVMQLARRGYKRPGYFISQDDYDHWEIGFYASLFHLGIRTKNAVGVCSKNLSKDALRERFQSWFLKYKPDVVITRYRQVPFACLSGMGLSVPEDVGFFHLDVLPRFQQFSGLIQLRDVAYRTAVEQLNGLISRNEYGPSANPLVIEIPTAWNEGTTIFPPAEDSIYR